LDPATATVVGAALAVALAAVQLATLIQGSRTRRRVQENEHRVQVIEQSLRPPMHDVDEQEKPQ
jgi:cell division septation protein DedD